MKKTCSTPWKARGRNPENFPKEVGINDGTGTDHYIEIDAKKRVDQPKPNPTNYRSTKYDLRHILRPTMLFRLGQLQNRSVFTHFIPFGSAAESSATSEYETVLERIGQNEEPNIEKRNGLRKSLVLVQNVSKRSVVRPNAHLKHEIMNSY